VAAVYAHAVDGDLGGQRVLKGSVVGILQVHAAKV
jgi:hypothetical protein